MISMPPPINRGYHDCGWSNAGLRRSRFLQTILRADPSSSQQSGSHCRFPAAPLPLPPENENTLENGAAFKVNLRVVGFRRLLLPFESSPLLIPHQGNRQLKASTQINMFTQKSVKLVRERINYLPNERINYLPQQVTKHDSRLSEHRLPR